ncbi:MAG: right-handed parallel beta-helix repeat-containing protein [Pseudomonadota bacterium]
MAISAGMVWEVDSAASAGNVNGGGFNPASVVGGGTDWTRTQSGPKYSLTGLTTAAANAIILTASASADMIGNIIFIDTAATNFIVGRYEILDCTPGVSLTVDSTCTSAAGAAGTAKIGGPLSLGSSDATVFNAMVSGNTCWVKNGTYSLSSVTVTTAGATTKPTILKGYNSSRGDNPTGLTRPLFNAGSTFLIFPANWDISYLQVTGTANGVFTTGASCKVFNVYVINTSTSAGLVGTGAGTNSFFQNCEFVSQNGFAIRPNGGTFKSCYIHDSSSGIYQDNINPLFIEDCLFAGNIVAGLFLDAAVSSNVTVDGCTFYGFEAKIGIGVKLNNNGITNTRILNSIFYGLATGVSHLLSTQTVGYDNNNLYNNNGTNATNWTLGPNSITTAPAFTSIANVTGSTGTTSGFVFTQLGADYSNVTDNQDYLYIASGSGITAMAYLITSHTATTLTLNVAPGTNATANKVSTTVTGRNWSPGVNAKAAGTPGLIPNTASTSYMDIGGVQRKELTSTDPGIANVRSGTNYTLNDASLTGTLSVTGGTGGNIWVLI